MNALLLCAGYGSRVSEITQHLPKCLMPINGTPIIERWILFLLGSGIDKIIINLHYKSEMVISYINSCEFKERIIFHYEEVLQGTAGTIINNYELLTANENSFFVCHVDNYTNFNFHEFLDAHINRPPITDMTMMLFECRDPKECGIVKIENNIVCEFHEKKLEDNGNLANSAIFLFEKRVFDNFQLSKIPNPGISEHLIPTKINKINTFMNNNYVIDIGTMNNFLYANKIAKYEEGDKININFKHFLLSYNLQNLFVKIFIEV